MPFEGPTELSDLFRNPDLIKSVFERLNALENTNIVFNGVKHPLRMSPHNGVVDLDNPGKPETTGSDTIELTVTADDPNAELDVAWTNVGATAEQLFLERSTDGVNFSPLVTLAGNATDHSDDTATPGTEYFYRIREFEAGQFSAWSNIDSGTLTAAPSSFAVYGWGSNFFYELGRGNNTTPQTTPTQIGGSTADWVKVSSGEAYAMAIKSSGELWGWGNNDWYNIGNGTNTTQQNPVQVGVGTDWANVQCGQNHTIALKTDGTLWAWGRNDNGQLGLGDATERQTPTQVGAATNWTKIACGILHTLALNSAGEIWAFGRNVVGQLGDETSAFDEERSPVRTGSATNWISIAAGGEHSAAINSAGELWAWGNNTNGELGHAGASTDVATKEASAATNWASVACGDLHTIAIKTTGTIWATGEGGSRQLGLGSTTDFNTFQQIGADTTWSQASAGWEHSMALKTDGTIWGWGNNGNGTLGVGDTTLRATPTQVGSDTDWASVASTSYTSHALKTPP